MLYLSTPANTKYRKSFIIHDKKNLFLLQHNFDVCRSFYMFAEHSMAAPMYWYCIIAISLSESLFFAFISVILIYALYHSLLSIFRSFLSVKVKIFTLFSYKREALISLIIQRKKKYPTINSMDMSLFFLFPLIYSWFVFLIFAVYGTLERVFVIRWCYCTCWNYTLQKVLVGWDSDQW